MCNYIFKDFFVKKKEMFWLVLSFKDKNRIERQCFKFMKGSYIQKNILVILNNIQKK